MAGTFETVKTVRYQALTWTGIVGGAVTLFSNLQGILDLADWARWLTAQWHEWAHAFWQSVFGWFGLRLPIEWSPLLSFCAFSLATAIGSRTQAGQGSGSRTLSGQGKRLLLGGLIFSAIVYVLAGIWLYTCCVVEIIPDRWSDAAVFAVFNVAAALSATILAFAHHKDRASYFIFVCLLSVFYYAMFVLRGTEALSSAGDASVQFFRRIGLMAASGEPYLTLPTLLIFSLVVLAFAILLYVFPILMLAICPVGILTHRLLFLAVGLGVLIALNQLGLYASGIRELLKPPI